MGTLPSLIRIESSMDSIVSTAIPKPIQQVSENCQPPLEEKDGLNHGS